MPEIFRLLIFLSYFGSHAKFSRKQDLPPMELHLHPVELRLRHTFSTSHESRDTQPSLIVGLSQNGQTGYGEATATRYYGLKLEDMMARLEALRPALAAMELQQPAIFWQAMRQRLSGHPFLLCALDEAAHDLHGKLQGKALHELWGLPLDQLPLSNYTIGMDHLPAMLQRMEEQPWPVYKIKLGSEHDLAIVRALREKTRAVFRIDANTGWTAAQTIAYAPELKRLGVEFIEQPLRAEDWKGMEQVSRRCALPVIADESCQAEGDIDRCHGYFQGVNIKLMKCGGLTPARRMIERARQLGLKVMVGCMTESSVGISAIAQLLPLLDYVDMDGALLLSNDPAEGVWLSEGRAYFPNRPGTGVRLKA